jgi:hypothetical protein
MIRTLAAGVLVAAGCGSAQVPYDDPGLEGLSLASLAPTVIVPGSQLQLEGDSFVGPDWGESSLHMFGEADGQEFQLEWPARFIDYDHLVVEVTDDMVGALGGDVDFYGTAQVAVISAEDGRAYSSEPIETDLTFRTTLTPSTTLVQSNTLIFVNDAITVEGDGFLLGGGEGATFAEVTGCFAPEGAGSCVPVAAQEIAVTPTVEFDRTRGSFRFAPSIAGISPGQFIGQVQLINRHASGAETFSPATQVSYDLVLPQVQRVTPSAVSLGQYAVVEGGGFVGGEFGSYTELLLDGSFTRGVNSPVTVNMTLIPEYFDGNRVRYVVSEDDALGNLLDLRTETGQFVGTMTPVVTYGSDTVTGDAHTISLAIAPVKQVVFLDFRPTYVESLRAFGLRAVDGLIRARAIEVLDRNYAGVNIEFRTEPPADFALFSHVELHGPDPNGMGLFGYDNTPGKDDGNVRLYDRLGGVNAQTQQDGYPGYGGVFVESLMGFSTHPGSLAQSLPGADATFDAIFDPFRPDRDGRPVSSGDLGGGINSFDSGEFCPADDRGERISCAVYVLGNLIGGTLAHEIGHSLGLANPYAEGFHNQGDGENRLMDAGGDRSFLERAELMDQGPAVFCTDEYSYLRVILPSSDPASTVARPPC